jgi:hypothetical protein
MRSGSRRRRALFFLFGSTVIAVVGVCWASAHAADGPLIETFGAGLGRWHLDGAEFIEIITEPGTSNRILQLTPRPRAFAHALLAEPEDWMHLRVEGRFQFPTEGDGYLGFIYNYQETGARMDFGCLYVKSNGSYVRVSPHHDGNPSWRLYEEMKVNLDGERRIQTGVWYVFRLDVHENLAEFYLEDMNVPVVSFDLFPHRSGAIGLEARPGGGEPAWVDDIQISKLPARDRSGPQSVPTEALWEALGPLHSVRTTSESDDPTELPELPEEGWSPIPPDARGALITGLLTQYRSGDKDVIYLRTTFEVSEGDDPPTWLASSSANRMDVWLNGFYRGTVAPERFIWSNFLTSQDNPGTRTPIAPRIGVNEIVLRVYGRRFAGGGLYLSLARGEDSF